MVSKKTRVVDFSIKNKFKSQVFHQIHFSKMLFHPHTQKKLF